MKQEDEDDKYDDKDKHSPQPMWVLVVAEEGILNSSHIIVVTR